MCTPVQVKVLAHESYVGLPGWKDEADERSTGQYDDGVAGVPERRAPEPEPQVSAAAQCKQHGLMSLFELGRPVRSRMLLWVYYLTIPPP
jgi:hypothetical protein